MRRATGSNCKLERANLFTPKARNRALADDTKTGEFVCNCGEAALSAVAQEDAMPNGKRPRILWPGKKLGTCAGTAPAGPAAAHP